MSALALPTTLRSVTATKIVELKKQRRVFEESKAAIGQDVKRRKLDLDKTKALVDGTSHLEGVRLWTDSDSDEDATDYSRSARATELRNARRLLAQASVDPAFPTPAVEKIFTDITMDLDLKSVQHQHAQFFSELVTEWISNPEEDVVTMDTDAGNSSSFEPVGRKEMHEQRAEWEKLVFTNSAVDGGPLSTYLEKLFKSHKPVAKAHDDLRRALSLFCYSLKSDALFDTDTLKIAIKGLTASDLLNEEKKAILKAFSSNKEVLKEVADVLNMRFKSLETWEWTTVNGAINLEQRRQLNGKYRVFMDEDVLDALLVHQIGMSWATELKSQFTTFFNSHAWQRNANAIPLADRERREWFLGSDEINKATIPHQRREDYARDYFLTQLPETMEDGYRGYDDDSDDGVRYDRKNPLEIKHGLLHLLIAETLVARHLHPDRSYTVIRSDFKWFGPSLSHTTLFTILRFFGVDDFWLNFFRKFLETPVRFVQDGENGEIKTRTRGVPMSHSLSDVLSEATLFVMDFAVANATRTNLYRLHDDFWFWGSTGFCRRAWHEMIVFCRVTGVEFNEEKTGSVTFQPKVADSDSDIDLTDMSSGLPTGDIRWGFLRLNADTVRFEIDQAKVDDQIKELKYQLDGCTSIFAYVQAYNSFLARSFTNNFGKPSKGFGRQHIDMMISTLTRIQNAMYPHGRVTDLLNQRANKAFNPGTLPDGFWYFPVAMGGMELRNPLVSLFCMRESMRRSPERIFQLALEDDEAAYLVAKEKYERTNTGAGVGKYNAELKVKMMNSGEANEFISREEYLKFREERSPSLCRAYMTFLTVPDEKPLESTNNIIAMLDTLVDKASPRRGGGRGRGRGKGKVGTISQKFDDMAPYWQWIVAVHGPEIVKMFGGLQMVDQAQVPLGVVSVMKAGKIRWRG